MKDKDFFTFLWRRYSPDGGYWYLGWPGLTPDEYRSFSSVKIPFFWKKKANRIYEDWIAEQNHGKIEQCPTCYGQGKIRVTNINA